MENSPSDLRRTRLRHTPWQRPLSPARASVLARLSGQPEPITVASLVTLTRMHENTLREHLNGLVHRGLARRQRAEPQGRGRPVWLYSETGADPTTPEYPGLAATMVNDIARSSAEPSHTATAIGDQWGRDLVTDRGWAPTSADRAREKTVELLDDLGFEPETDPRAAQFVRLRRCPLLEAAHRDPDVVCQVHLGIVRGALIELGADPTGSTLVPFAEPGACLLTMPPLTGS